MDSIAIRSYQSFNNAENKIGANCHRTASGEFTTVLADLIFSGRGLRMVDIKKYTGILGMDVLEQPLTKN